jgi:hypothetical protein
MPYASRLFSVQIFQFFWQTWLPTVQEVLQADWQEFLHSPQPPVFTVVANFPVTIV